MTINRERLSKHLEHLDHPSCDKAESRWMEFMAILNQERVMQKHVLTNIKVGWMDGSITEHRAFYKPIEFKATTYLGLDGDATGIIIGNLHAPGQLDHILADNEHGYRKDVIDYFLRQGCIGVALRPLFGEKPIREYEKPREVAGKLAYLMDREHLTDGQPTYEEVQEMTTYQATHTFLTIGDVPFDEHELAQNIIDFWR